MIKGVEGGEKNARSIVQFKKFLTKEAGGDKNPACIVNTADGRIFTVAYYKERG